MCEMRLFDRTKLLIKPLSERKNNLSIEKIAVSPDALPPAIPESRRAQVRRLAERIKAARLAGRSVILTFGAHLIKNGLAPVVIRLIEDGWLTHLATNGAGSIHDWEFAFQGASSEDVRENTARGEFGTWEETGRSINLAVAVGGMEDLGYGWSVGKMIADDGLRIPNRDDLCKLIAESAAQGIDGETLGALSDMLYLTSSFDLPSGWMAINHRFKEYSLQHAAYKLGVPFTVHPGIGYDIIYTHPLNCGGAIGRGAVRDFLAYAESVRGLSGGVHISVGTAVMGPMIFEKALSMSNNLALQEDGRPLSDHYMAVVDIQEGGDWDWTTGEPPTDHPAYYLRFCKTFYRMGGSLDYLCLDNRDFLANLYKELRGRE